MLDAGLNLSRRKIDVCLLSQDGEIVTSGPRRPAPTDFDARGRQLVGDLVGAAAGGRDCGWPTEERAGASAWTSKCASGATRSTIRREIGSATDRAVGPGPGAFTDPPSRRRGCASMERLHARDARPSRFQNTALRLGAVNLGVFFAAQPDTPVKLGGFAFAFEHLEIAAYEAAAAGRGPRRRPGDRRGRRPDRGRRALRRRAHRRDLGRGRRRDAGRARRRPGPLRRGPRVRYRPGRVWAPR